MTIYNKKDVAFFFRVREQWGGLSNMASGYPITFPGGMAWSSEALYQACRFTDHPEIQDIILGEKNPMASKLKAKKYKDLTRSDWETPFPGTRVDFMFWALSLKAHCNPSFKDLLLSTGDLPIVEKSRKDSFWGAIEVGDLLVGNNVLGKLLMDLRGKIRKGGFKVEDPAVENFKYPGAHPI